MKILLMPYKNTLNVEIVLRLEQVPGYHIQLSPQFFSLLQLAVLNILEQSLLKILQEDFKVIITNQDFMEIVPSDLTIQTGFSLKDSLLIIARALDEDAIFVFNVLED